MWYDVPRHQLDAALTAVAAYLNHVHADDADSTKSVFDGVKCLFSDNHFDFLGHDLASFNSCWQVFVSGDRPGTKHLAPTLDFTSKVRMLAGWPAFEVKAVRRA